MSFLLRLIAALLLVSPAAVTAGCGSDAGVAGQSAEDVLRTTFGPARPVTSGRLDVGLSVEGQALAGAGDGPVRLNLRGPFDAPEGGRGVPAFAFDLVVGSAGRTVTAGAVSTGRAGFLTYGGRAYALNRRTWAELERGYAAGQRRSGGRGDRTLAALGVDPRRWLRDPEKVGEEDVGGVRTVHVRAGVDVRALLDDVERILARAGTAGAGALPAAQRRTIEEAVRSASLDVFTGTGDGLLRRLNVQVAFAAGRLGLDLRLAELNEPQEITPPKDARPLSELTGSAARRGSAPRPQGPGSPYGRCLDDAGGDLTKAQRCADLVRAP